MPPLRDIFVHHPKGPFLNCREEGLEAQLHRRLRSFHPGCCRTSGFSEGQRYPSPSKGLGRLAHPYWDWEGSACTVGLGVHLEVSIRGLVVRFPLIISPWLCVVDWSIFLVRHLGRPVFIFVSRMEDERWIVEVRVRSPSGPQASSSSNLELWLAVGSLGGETRPSQKGRWTWDKKTDGSGAGIKATLSDGQLGGGKGVRRRNKV
jgi:hypothetical protein